jgi:hypothetical protein
VGHWTVPRGRLRQQAAAHEAGAAVPANAEGGDGEEMVREHHRHTARPAAVLVQTGRSQVVLPTRAVKGTAAHRAGTRAPHHHRPCLRPNYDEHQHWKVTDRPRVRAIELRTTMEAYPTTAVNWPAAGSSSNLRSVALLIAQVGVGRLASSLA